MAKITSLEDFDLYQDTLSLVVEVIALTKSKTLAKEYWLVDQVKRAVFSIAANISEGYGRYTKKDFAHFLSISLGSCNELRTFMDVFLKLDIEKDKCQEVKEKTVSIGKRLFFFRRKLLQTENKTTNHQQPTTT